MIGRTKQRMTEMLRATSLNDRQIDAALMAGWPREILAWHEAELSQREAAAECVGAALAISEAQRHIRSSHKFVLGGYNAWRDAARISIDKVLSDDQDGRFEALPVAAVAPSLDEARKRAHEAFNAAYYSNTSDRGAAFERGLDIFIAARPPGNVAATPLPDLSRPHRTMTPEEYAGLSIKCPHIVQQDFDGAGNVSIWFLSAEVTSSIEPQPEEVPPHIGIIVAEMAKPDPNFIDRRVDIGGIADFVWNAARRYAPMPARVTDAMVKAGAESLGHAAGLVNVRRLLEAALAAAPKEPA